MADEDFTERLTKVENSANWLHERIWSGTGNHHDRIHVLEDKNGDRAHEIEMLQGKLARIERVLGLNGYGDKNVLNDLKAALNTIEKIKGGIISVKDFLAMQGQIAELRNDLEEITKWRELVSSRSWQLWLLVIGSLVTSILSLVLK